jgi:hypothetical protein
MIDTIRIRTKDEQTALSLAHYDLARFHPVLSQENEEWNVVVETESEEDLPDLLSILYDQLHAPDRSIDVLFNGEPYSPRERR